MKNNTLKPENIIQTDGYFRYVNHQDGLATTGFKTRDKLLYYTNNIRFDCQTIKLMKKRYDEMFSQNSNQTITLN